jgi:uncharacterized damage-inducible protein DinB
VATDAGTRNEVRGGITRPAHRADERTTLTGQLQRLRDLVAWKVQDATDEDLYATATPGGMVIPGVIRHLENVERWWFRDVFAGETGLAYDWTDDDQDGEFHVPPGVPVASLLDAYRAEQVRCSEVVDAAPSLDAISMKGERSLRWILVHLIQETARHLGHIDALRERADGSVGEEPE